MHVHVASGGLSPRVWVHAGTPRLLAVLPGCQKQAQCRLLAVAQASLNATSWTAAQ